MCYSQLLFFCIFVLHIIARVSLGSIIYGRIMVDPQQSLGSAYHVSVEKIFVCTGLDGYIPQYNPDSNEYGCLADSKLLSYRFKILVSLISCILVLRFSLKIAYCIRKSNYITH